MDGQMDGQTDSKWMTTTCSCCFGTVSGLLLSPFVAATVGVVLAAVQTLLLLLLIHTKITSSWKHFAAAYITCRVAHFTINQPIDNKQTTNSKKVALFLTATTAKCATMLNDKQQG